MARTHERPQSPEPLSDPEAEPSLLKRMKVSHISNPDAFAEHFATDLFAPSNIHRLHSEYDQSTPYKHAVVEKLVQDDLLQRVKDEALEQLSFSEKETDIYKVKQTGDLASLSFLTDDQRALLPNLLTFRDALYSPKFRAFVRAVTGCGPLSGTKQDMSVVSYSKSCHLLNHDDVIGTRRISYILYMPLPHYMGWQPEWGGALELYPTKLGPDGVLEPESVPSKSIPPSWNQFIFFEVKPGSTFHSVEEVVVGEREDGRERLSISGWFHSPQPGEEGYQPESNPPELKSSREQLAFSSTEFKSYPESLEPPLPDEPLSETDKSFLEEYLNPVYLQARTMKALASRFVEESSLELHELLCTPLASKLETGLRNEDAADGLGLERPHPIPPHTVGTAGAWTIKGPPHKWRYCTLGHERNGAISRADPRWAQSSPDEIVRALQDELFPSPSFRRWLAIISRLLPLRYAVEARRFRPGLDYTLATGETKDARLDVVIGLTPQVKGEKVQDEEEDEEDELPGWQSGEWGGWECYMAPHEGEGDPAVYGSSSGATNAKASEVGSSRKQSPMGEGSSPMLEDADEDDEDNGTLLTVQPGFNRLLLVLRDEGVMHFVKYVSAAAQGSRWDVCGEFEIGMIEEETDD
ncbi:nuclear protein [Laetiporus sulphureus 93-53]|uniref:uS12 prolyl 3,4-dihydroxylase n=1 Tax=Laetiporus sulphureus 93-53 TaxID=1314785 RepID=A0A165I4Q0_9APHY|nr:nuclear protein [Laetiporus sulphureus 93-53]KZT12591.1 nuclear protein [Laetiporus sulphureus 93-53]